jgi:hypothetical protein
MSHICKVEVSHFPVEQAVLECGRGIDCHERTRAEPHRSMFVVRVFGTNSSLNK